MEVRHCIGKANLDASSYRGKLFDPRNSRLLPEEFHAVMPHIHAQAPALPVLQLRVIAIATT